MRPAFSWACGRRGSSDAAVLNSSSFPQTSDEFHDWFDRETFDLRQAYSYFIKAAETLPATPHRELLTSRYSAGQAAVRMHLVNGLGKAGSTYLDSALEHFQIALQVSEALDNARQTAEIRQTIAQELLKVDRRAAARNYAVAALIDLQSLGDGTMAEQVKLYKLLARIDQEEEV
jgi:hypothetical protein